MKEPDHFRSRVRHSFLPWSWYDVGLALLLTVPISGLFWFGGRWLQNTFGGTADTGLIDPGTYLFGAGIYLALTISIYVSVARRAGWPSLGLRPASLLNYLLVLPLFITGLFGLALANLLVMQLAGQFENPQVAAISGGNPLGQAEVLALLLLVAGVVPVVEELFFRGMLYPLLRERMPAFFAIVLNALLFALVHFIPVLIPGLFVVGLMLAYLRERSGSIWPGVLYHSLQNALGVLAISLVLT
jgi:membrane protease YdiL (CAAX protease family)